MRLVRKNGTSVPLTLDGEQGLQPHPGRQRGPRLIDLENGKGFCTEGDKAVNPVITGTVPKGDYVGARMYMGVPVPAQPHRHHDRPPRRSI